MAQRHPLQQEDPQQGCEGVEGKREPKQRIPQQVSHVREMPDGRRPVRCHFEQELPRSENERDTRQTNCVENFARLSSLLGR